MAEIRADFRAQFPVFDVPVITDAILDQYINLAFCNVPGGFIQCGFECAYEAFLYGIAHNLTYFDALNSTSLIPGIKDKVKSKSADGLSISYENNQSDSTPTNLANFFSATPYGMLLLTMLDTCGLTSSPGGFIV